MFTKRRIYQILATVITFFLGIVFQSLLNQWFPVKDLANLALIAIIVVITLVLTILLETFYLTEIKLENVENRLEDIIKRSGIKLEYVEDNYEGKSYKRSTELIEKARVSLTFVSPWEPAMEYQPGIYSEEVFKAKQKYYKTIEKQIESFIGKDTLFHRRILQVPPNLINDPSFPFKNDSSFVDYLHFAAKVQRAHPRICQIKMVPTMTGAHFTIVDSRYVIVTTAMRLDNEHSVRQGEIIIEDGQGELIKYFQFLYQTLESRSRPLEPDYFEKSA